MQKTDKSKLRIWQDRLAKSETAFNSEIEKMNGREALYRGDRTIKAQVRREVKKQASHVRNICAELIEAQVDSAIPAPKVTARRAGDEMKAKLIEDMLRNELDRMPFEQMNDMMSRTVPIQGGAAFLVEWDNTLRTHQTVGEVAVSVIHPKQIIPQDGIHNVDAMDYIFLKLPQTKESIRRRYGIDVSDESEREPDIRTSENSTNSDELVTQYVAYYRNDNGGIGLYSWVGDTQLADLPDYQARRLRRCEICGAVEPLYASQDEDIPAGGEVFVTGKDFAASEKAILKEQKPTSGRRESKKCPFCGGNKWKETDEEYEEVYLPIPRSDGSEIPGEQSIINAEAGELDEMGMPQPSAFTVPTRIPFYKPNVFPIILQKNVSVFGKFLGDSDIDKIADQQNTVNRIETKIIDKLIASGSYITLPNDPGIKIDPDDGKVIRLGNPADRSLIGVFDMQGAISQDLAYLSQVYEEARQIIGITDSFQGRRDSTATSGVAKEFAAAQTAGRLESKRVMKDAAYAALFETIFKFKLAYADEPRPVVSDDIHGNKEYTEFNRYDFLEQDEAGEWCWNDQFLFSCDTSAPLAANREAMWQETRMNLQTGAFGDPSTLQTLILFWNKMEMLHYPGAGETKQYLEEELNRQQEEAQMQAQQMQMIQQMQQTSQTQAAMPQGMPAEAMPGGGQAVSPMM